MDICGCCGGRLCEMVDAGHGIMSPTIHSSKQSHVTKLSKCDKCLGYGNACDFCSKIIPRQKKTSCPCFFVTYCNPLCQKNHWKNHKADHRRLSKAMKLEKDTEVGVKHHEASVEDKNKVVDDCPVCQEALPLQSGYKFSRMSCCGKGLHLECLEKLNSSGLFEEHTCPFCKAKEPQEHQVWNMKYANTLKEIVDTKKQLDEALELSRQMQAGGASFSIFIPMGGPTDSRTMEVHKYVDGVAQKDETTEKLLKILKNMDKKN